MKKALKFILVVALAVAAAPGLFFLLYVVTGWGEGYCYLYPSIDTRYAKGYSEETFQTITVGMKRDEVDRIMCVPLGVGTNRDSSVEYGYTCDGKSRIGDFAWFGRSLKFSNDVVVSVTSRLYMD